MVAVADLSESRKQSKKIILIFAALGAAGIIVAMSYVAPQLFLSNTSDTKPLRIASNSYFKIKVGEEAPFLSMAKGGKEPYQYAWDFGDGGVSLLQNTTHIYAKEGTYRVLLTVTDSRGTKSDAAHDVQVFPPNANFTRGEILRY